MPQGRGSAFACVQGCWGETDLGLAGERRRRAAEAQRAADASAAHFRAELASARDELGTFRAE
jgi:hypothetical protein